MFWSHKSKIIFYLIRVEQVMSLPSNIFVLILLEPIRRYKTYHSDIFSTSSESPSIISSESDVRQGEKHLNKQSVFKKPWLFFFFSSSVKRIILYKI